MLAAFLGLLVLAWHIASYGGRSFDAPVDAAVVLGAAVWGDKPSPVYRERIREAINRYRNKQVKYLVFTGGTPKANYLSEGEVGRAFAIRHGVPPEAILMETTSRTTWQNLVNAKTLLETLGANRVLVISDPLHLRRAVAMAKDLDLDALPGPTASSRFQSLPKQARFLWNEVWRYLHYLVLGHRFR
ncbi:YdcF family protein [Noviherbaspirillum malthae]|uniref:YdcF family protein n=1 Tax=Noviherbaspirillum malthae TaxID=1260987 RepID=UPI001E4E5518|nr:YdcF family protein [Noviherbaspirillum malthae]